MIKNGNPKCRPHEGMSEYGGTAENIYSLRAFRILTHIGTRTRTDQLRL